MAALPPLITVVQKWFFIVYFIVIVKKCSYFKPYLEILKWIDIKMTKMIDKAEQQLTRSSYMDNIFLQSNWNILIGDFV